MIEIMEKNALSEQTRQIQMQIQQLINNVYISGVWRVTRSSIVNKIQQEKKNAA
jgi:hypothetical protein